MRPVHTMKSRSFGTIGTAILPLLLCPAIGLADSGTKPPAERPPILDTIEQQGLRIVGEMQVPGGLRAFAAKAGAQPVALYLTPDNQHVIVGTLVDAYGQDMAAEQLKTLLEAPIAAEGWQKLEQSAWVRDGREDAPRVVYTFTDPNCPYCNKFWHAARPWVEAGKVQLRHVMVGVIRQDSPGKAAAILEAKSPEEALTRNETAQGEDRISPLQSIGSETLAKLESNASLMTELGFGGTPAIIYRNDDGTIATVSGLPQGGALDAVLGPR